MSAKSFIQELAYKFEQEDAAAFDLWSWLPTHKVAEKNHGDYASEYRPSNADVMREAAMVLAEAAGHTHTDAERAEWFEACPCGDVHSEPPAA